MTCIGRILFISWLLFAPWLVFPAAAQEPPADAAAEKQFEALAERYWKILLARPRRDTALDLCYRHYLDAGKLEELVERVRSHALGKPEDANAQLLLGLVLERRGDEEAALAAYASAEKLAAKNYYPPLVRGLLLARRQQLDLAAEALARAASLNPPRTDLPDIYKRLGRVRLQQGKIKEALEAFSQLAEAFPDDRQVLEELAQLLTDEGQPEEALRRWEQLAALSADDPLQNVQARLEIAQLKIAAGKRNEGIALLEQALSRVKPDSWLERDIRRRLEQAFVASADIKGLIAWCEARLKSQPQDLGTLLQLARALEQNNQRELALPRYQEAVRLAPSRRDLREALIDALVSAGQHAEAIIACEELVKQHPQEADPLRRLGQLHVAAADLAARPAAEARAVEIWKQIAAIRPQDAALALATAEACRHALTPTQIRPAKPDAAPHSPLLVAAEAFYREAVRRAPDDPQYYEYLGEFLHAREQKSEAVAAWSKIGELPKPSAESFHRLAEVLSSFDCLSEAIAASAKSIEHKPDDFLLRDFHLGLLLKHKSHAEALAALDQLDRLATDDAAREKTLARRVEVLAAAERIAAEIHSLEQSIQGGKAGVREHWLLGLLQAHRWEYAKAADSFKAGLDLDADHLPLARAYAEALKLAGHNEAASQQYQRLAKLDPRARVTYYQEIIQLQLKQGEMQKAKQAADLLVQLSPANVDVYRIRATVAFRAKDVPEGLRNLRQAVKMSPRDVDLRTELARALADHGERSDALEHYWRSFELSENLSDKQSLVAKLIDVAQRSAKANEVVDQLRRLRVRQDEPKTLTLCLVEALLRLKRHDEAQRELLALLQARGEDVDVLRQLAQIAQRLRSWDAAVGYQERVVALDPSRQSMEALAGYFSAKSDFAGAARIWERMLLDAADDKAAASVIDRQLEQGRLREALALAELRLSRTPGSWPLLLRAGDVSLALGNAEDAKLFYVKLLDLPDESDAARAAATVAAPSAATTSPGMTALGGVGFVSSPSGQRYMTSYAASQTVNPAPVFAAGFPQLRELQAAREAISRAVLLLNHATRATAQRIVPAQVATRFPGSHASTLEEAKQQAMGSLCIVAAQRSELPQVIAIQLKNASNDVRQLRRLALIASAMSGSLSSEFPELLDKLEQVRPEDALPHLLRLQPVARSAQAGPDQLADIKRSFEWLVERQPEARADLVYFYVTQLIMLRDTRATAAVLDEELVHVTRFADLGLLASVVLRSGDEALLRIVLKRGAELEVAPANAAAELPHLKLLLDHLLVYSQRPSEEDANCLLTITERYLAAPLPPPAAKPAYSPFLTSPAASASMPVARPTPAQSAMPVAPPGARSSMPIAGAAASLQIRQDQAEQARLASELNRLQSSINALQARAGGDKRVAGELAVLNERKQAMLNLLRTLVARVPGNAPRTFPLATAMLDLDRLDILQGVHFWLKQSDREPLLEQRLAKRTAESQGEPRRAFRLAGIYAAWWGGKKTEALEQLTAWCETEPKEQLLRVLLAQAHIANEEPRLALAELGRIREADAETVAEVERLRAEIRRRWSDLSLLRELNGHTHVVRAIAFSPDGLQLVSGSYDRSVRIWNARSGRPLRQLNGHQDMVLAVAWSPTGELIASAGYDGTRLWSAASGKKTDTLAATSVVRAVAFSPDGKLLATAGDDKIIHLWNVTLGSEVAALEGHQGPVLGLAFSPDGAMLASASRDHTIRIWNTASRQLADTLTGHSAAVTCVAFSPDGQRLASGSEDKTVMLWRLPDGKVFATLQQHTDAVQAVAFAPGGQTLASAGADKTIRLWRPDLGSLPDALLGHNHTVCSLAFSPANPALATDVLASSGFDELIKLWAVAPDTGK